MILSFINIRKVPRFSTPPWDLANVNEWKIIFDPYSNTSRYIKYDVEIVDEFYELSHQWSQSL